MQSHPVGLRSLISKDVEKMHEIGEKRHKCKSTSNFHCDGKTHTKIGRLAAEKWTFVCQ